MWTGDALPPLVVVGVAAGNVTVVVDLRAGSVVGLVEVAPIEVVEDLVVALDPTEVEVAPAVEDDDA
jgi:hypothetical protein